MESVVKYIKGDKIELSGKCFFCNKESTEIFFITNSEKKLPDNNIMITGFNICQAHIEILDALMNKKILIDSLFPYVSKKTVKRFNLRGSLQGIQIAKTNNIKHLKNCEFVGCSNKFMGTGKDKYCHDKRCKELRKEQRKTIKYKKYKDITVKNIILNKKIKTRLKVGQVIKIRCRAKNKNNIRCKNILYITYHPIQSVYPCYCPEHRSSYRRERFCQS